ncbi:MAG: hypothetical protein H6822_03570 [Planctomycetaceae bacterium]|nr:hypothetical protein [Planctomycetales bacterium]MCB9921234.1 hypothetical protein [Planctomycetaceae bacterium]
MSIKRFWTVMSMCVASLGCSPAPPEVSAPPSESSRELSGDNGTETPLPVVQTSEPGAVVLAFLDALRDGDDEIAETLLTSIARRETKEHDLTVQPPGSPSARYTIGEVRHVQGGVHVNSNWIEYDESGEQSNYDIVWVLRQEPVGWRVAGMATAVIPNKPPIYLNFEDVPDLLQKWQQADAELAAQVEEVQDLQAAQPSTTLQR